MSSPEGTILITANDYQSGSFRPDHEETPPVEAKGEIAVAVAVEVAVAAGSETIQKVCSEGGEGSQEKRN